MGGGAEVGVMRGGIYERRWDGCSVHNARCRRQIWRMFSPRSWRAVPRSAPLAVVAAGLFVLACRDEPPPRPSPPAVAPPPVQLSPAVARRIAAWDGGIGPFLVVRRDNDESPGTARLLRPGDVEGHFGDSATAALAPLQDTVVDLFARSGALGQGTVAAALTSANGAGCTGFPMVTLRSAPHGWRIGVARGHASAIPLDSVSAMSPADSAAFTDAVRALLKGSTAVRDSTFEGVPFVVRKGYHFATAGVETIVAEVRRGIPSEADSREQTAFVIGERAVGAATPYRMAYVQSASAVGGPSQVTDLLAAVTLQAGGRPVLVVSREGENGGTVGFIERMAPGDWRATWTSAYAGC